jgi:hypothetical protein
VQDLGLLHALRERKAFRLFELFLGDELEQLGLLAADDILAVGTHVLVEDRLRELVDDGFRGLAPHRRHPLLCPAVANQLQSAKQVAHVVVARLCYAILTYIWSR